MSTTSPEIARAFFDAWNARDADALAAAVHPEGEILLPRNLLEGGSSRGPQGARRALADALDSWEEVTVHVEDVREGDEAVAVLARTVNTPPGGPRTEYTGHADAIEAASVSE